MAKGSIKESNERTEHKQKMFGRARSVADQDKSPLKRYPGSLPPLEHRNLKQFPQHPEDQSLAKTDWSH
eukprot:2140332-Amphidinium_carterae.1